MNRKKVLLVGSILIERQFFVDSIADKNQVAISHLVNTLTSSKVINAGRIIASNHSVEMLGGIGRDLDAKKALSDLSYYNIGSKFITSTSQNPTGQVIVITDKNGSSAITVYLGASMNIDMSPVNEANLYQYDFIYMTTDIPLNNMYDLINLASKLNVRILLDFPNQQKDFDKKYLREVAIVSPNRQEAELLLNTKIFTLNDAKIAAKKLKTYTKGHVIITLDKDGCVLCPSTSDEILYIEAKQVDAKDDTASGDIFRSVLISDLLINDDISESASCATKIATDSVMVSGVNQSLLSTIALLKHKQ